MNPRIQELAEQSGVIHEFMTVGEKFDALKRFEKCVKLIVRECLVQIDNGIPDTNCSASGAYKTAKIAATNRVKQHFGVEQ